LLEWRSRSDYNGPGDFVFPSQRHKGKKPLDLAAVLKRKIQPAFAAAGIIRAGWHTFRHTVGAMLAEMGEHQLTIRDYLRPQQSPCDEQISSSNAGEQTFGARQAGGCHLAKWAAVGEQINSYSVVDAGRRIPAEKFHCPGEWAAEEELWRLIGPKRTQIFFWGVAS
jgi:hypothetical protein